MTSYVQAIDRHDGSALCRMFDSGVAAHFEHVGSRRFACSKLVHAFIGYVEDSGQPEWKAVSLKAPAAVLVSGRWAVARFYVTHRIAYTSGTDRPLVEADALPLVFEDGHWRLASSGRTLAIASGLLYDDPAAAASGWEAASTPEKVAQEYVTSLSGGPPGLCVVVGQANNDEPCWGPVLVDKLLPQPGKPAWQAAQIDHETTETAGRRAVVKLALTETYLSPRGILLTRAMVDQLAERLTRNGWQPASPSLVYYHARGLSGPPRSQTAAVLPAGKDVVSDGALQVAASGQGAALFAQSQSGRTAKLRLFVFRDGTEAGARILATVMTKYSAGYAFAGTAAAGDLGRGPALVAWTAFSVYTGVNVLPIGPSGQPLGPIRRYGVPHYTSPSQPYKQNVAGSDQEATAPRLSYNQRLHRYLLVWNEGQATEGRAMTLVLNDQGVAVSPPQAISGLMYASVAPTPNGWLAVSSALSSAPELIALNAAGQALTRRTLEGRTQAILSSNGDSDLITWSTTSANFKGPRFVRAQFLTPRGDPAGWPLSVAKVTPSTDHPVTVLPVQATATTAGYIVGWQYQSRDTFSYQHLNDSGKSTGGPITYEIHSTAGFQPAEILPPALTLTSGAGRAWLWSLGELRSARVVAIP